MKRWPDKIDSLLSHSLFLSCLSFKVVNFPFTIWENNMFRNFSTEVHISIWTFLVSINIIWHWFAL